MDFTSIKTFNDLLDVKYGKPEAPERKEFEEKALTNYQMDSNLEKCLSLYRDSPELGIFVAKTNGLLIDFIKQITEKSYSLKEYWETLSFNLTNTSKIHYQLLHRIGGVYYESVFSTSVLGHLNRNPIYGNDVKSSKTKEQMIDSFIPHVINHLNEIYPDESTTRI